MRSIARIVERVAEPIIEELQDEYLKTLTQLANG